VKRLGLVLVNPTDNFPYSVTLAVPTAVMTVALRWLNRWHTLMIA